MRFLAPLLLAATFNGCVAGELSFDKQTLTKDFVAEGCAVGDFDHDGHVDVAAGWFIWKGPDFKQRIAYAVEPSHDKGPNKTPFKNKPMPFPCGTAFQGPLKSKSPPPRPPGGQ